MIAYSLHVHPSVGVEIYSVTFSALRLTGWCIRLELSTQCTGEVQCTDTNSRSLMISYSVHVRPALEAQLYTVS